MDKLVGKLGDKLVGKLVDKLVGKLANLREASDPVAREGTPSIFSVRCVFQQSYC